MRVVLIAVITVALPCIAHAQWDADIVPFSSAAVIFGAQGFARPPITTGVAGAYAQAGVRRFLIGAQGGLTFGDGDRSRAAYGLATIGYAQTRARGWQLYPFIGVGAAAFRTSSTVTADIQSAYGAGFGADGLLSPHATGVMIGARIGYITRSLADDASVAYAMLTLGIGSRRGSPTHRDVAAAASA